MRIRQIIKEWQSFKAFKQVPRADRKIVFYSEGAGYWSYFEPVISALRNEFNGSVLYVTSSEHDPVYREPPRNLAVFNVGLGIVRTLFFATLDADVLVMTMPDLQVLHIKRSHHNVHYAYLNHSMVSTHMVYRPGAFDYFDSFLCAGPHHVREIRARELALSLKPKVLVEHGYGRLDQILARSIAGPLPKDANSKGRVLIAPSWGPESLIERYGSLVVKPLLHAGFRVTLRPHPQTMRLNPSAVSNIVKECGDNPMFSLDLVPDAYASLSGSDLMISDWSGAALDFAFGLERPVLFIDVPRKILDPQYSLLGMEPLEAHVRTEIGVVVSPLELERLPIAVEGLIRDGEQWQSAARKARGRWVFNVGDSGNAGAKFLLSLVQSNSESSAGTEEL